MMTGMVCAFGLPVRMRAKMNSFQLTRNPACTGADQAAIAARMTAAWRDSHKGARKRPGVMQSRLATSPPPPQGLEGRQVRVRSPNRSICPRISRYVPESR